MHERILFDIDGTLLDSEWAIRQSLSKLMEKELGSSPDPGNIPLYFGLPPEDSLRLLGFKNPAASCETWAAYMSELYSQVKLFPGIKEMIIRLYSRGYKIGIVTSTKRQQYLDRFQRHFDLSGYLEGVICFEDTGMHKPHPEPLLEYLHRYDCPASTALYVANTVHDFNSANQAGIDFALASWGSNGIGVIQAMHQLHTPGALLELLGIGN